MFKALLWLPNISQTAECRIFYFCLFYKADNCREFCFLKNNIPLVGNIAGLSEFGNFLGDVT